MSLLELLLLANIKNICRNTVAREGSRGGKSNKAIADYFISLPMRRITGEGKGKAEREKRGGMRRTVGAKSAARGGEYPILEEPLRMFSSGFQVGLTSNPLPADVGLNRSPKLTLAASTGPIPVPSTQEPVHLHCILIFEFFQIFSLVRLFPF